MTPAPHPASVRLRTAALLGTALLALTTVLTACSSDPEPDQTTAKDTSSPEPSVSTSAPPVPSLLSGRMGRPDQPVFAVKIDNTAKAHPQVGLSKADVVYVEQVEGGVTRLAAIYSSEYPRYVGPVRSARITDIGLLKQYGKVGLIYSGSQNKLLDNLRRAPLGLVSFDADRSGYRRASDRTQPYDVIGTFDDLRGRAGKVDPPSEVGYTFGPASLGGKPAKAVTVRYPGARVGAQWSAKGERWLLSMDGAPAMAAEGGRLGPTTLVVQFTDVMASNYYDINGANTPLTETVGKGRTLVFRDGQVYQGAWSRAKAGDPTAYTIGGAPAVFAPGQVWVALLGRDRPVTIG
ncbi:MAG: DUF3048 domain-containing protein [Spirochaetaceae bacterium]|nr:DUF3048 domain-containing protein [Spirochaetaceae bacterium]